MTYPILNLALAGLGVYTAVARSLPLVGSGKLTLWLLFLVGFASHGLICTSAVVPPAPVILVGVALGLFNLVLVISATTRLHPKFLTTQRAIMTLGIIMAVKVAIATVMAMAA